MLRNECSQIISPLFCHLWKSAFETPPVGKVNWAGTRLLHLGNLYTEWDRYILSAMKWHDCSVAYFELSFLTVWHICWHCPTVLFQMGHLNPQCNSSSRKTVDICCCAYNPEQSKLNFFTLHCVYRFVAEFQIAAENY